MRVVGKASLRVEEGVREDAYKDIVRVHWTHRGQPALKVGTIVKLSANGEYLYVAIRGLNDQDIDAIRMDFVIRDELHLRLGQTYDFTIAHTSAWEKLKWACGATDPAARIAAWIAVWSAALGIIGLILGIISVVPVVKDWTAKPIELPKSGTGPG